MSLTLKITISPREYKFGSSQIPFLGTYEAQIFDAIRVGQHACYWSEKRPKKAFYRDLDILRASLHRDLANWHDYQASVPGIKGPVRNIDVIFTQFLRELYAFMRERGVECSLETDKE